MTQPTITYGHGYLTDCDDATGWNQTQFGMPGADSTLTVQHNEYFQLSGIFNGQPGGVEWAYYEKDITDISSDVYTTLTCRFKTSEASAGARAKIVIEFDDATTQTIMSSRYSSQWVSFTATITAGKNIDLIRLYIDEDNTNGTFYVYYDFIMLHIGTFTFPHVGPGGIFWTYANKDVELDIWGREGGVGQSGGMRFPQLNMKGSMMYGESWGATYGANFYGLGMIYAFRDVWNWFMWDYGGVKLYKIVVKLGMPAPGDEETYMTYEFNATMYNLGVLDLATWGSWEWLGYEP